ncbi:S1 RNA-binding domain-containing protein [Gemella sp. 19428wG2_WT2a]|nr:S1 RNA-binding domain-containing protein [Gemella sp. 19428wG2_WT2a]TFU58177.1 S1 RNA-binding domain-containing protein [Gemella sp. WT2a]
MELIKGNLVEAKVTKVDNQGLFLDLKEGVKAFLPKQNMHVGKKKKLTEIFSEGYIISAKVLSRKKDYYVLSQKEIEQTQSKTSENKAASKEVKNTKKKSKKESKTQEKSDKRNLKESNSLAVEDKQEEKKSIKLEDLKKLKSFGSMKISVQKKNSIKSLAEEKKQEEEKPEILDIPENFVENIQKSFEENSKKFNDILKRLKEEGYIDEI